MRRVLGIVGCAIIVLAGLAFVGIAKPWQWWIVWFIDFPIMYAAILGIIRIVTDSREADADSGR